MSEHITEQNADLILRNNEVLAELLEDHIKYDGTDFTDIWEFEDHLRQLNKSTRLTILYKDLNIGNLATFGFKDPSDLYEYACGAYDDIIAGKRLDNDKIIIDDFLEMFSRKQKKDRDEFIKQLAELKLL